MKKKDFIKNRFYSRRQFLIGVGGHMLLLPTLPSLLPKKLYAATTPQRKLALFPMEFGMLTELLRPNRTAVKPLLTEYSDHVHYAALKDLPQPLSFIIDSSYSDLLDDLNLFYGLGGTGEGGHTYGIFAGSNAAIPDDNTNRKPTYGRTIDVIIENSSPFKSSFSGGVPTLRIASKVNYGKVMCWDRSTTGSPISMSETYSDRKIFNTVFGSGGLGPQAEVKLDARKVSVADSILQDLNKLKNNSRISSNDLEMLDRYVSSINDLQKRLLDKKTCSPPSLEYQYKDNRRNDKIEGFSADKVLDNYFEMATLALACGQSRIFSLHNHYGSPEGYSLPHHFDGENTIEETNKSAIRQKWYLKKIAGFARKLKSFPDPSGTGSLFDHSLLMVLNEHGSRRAHSSVDLPALTFGSLGGKINSGYYIDYRQKDRFLDDTKTPHGHPRKQLLISALRGMGVPKSEYINDGDGNGFGMFQGKQAEQYTSLFSATHNDPLPFYSK